MHSLNLTLIGNGSLSALVDGRANIVWSCMPRFDSAPVFGALLRNPADTNTDSIYSVDLKDFAAAKQTYLENTAIVRTRLYDSHGGAIEVVDFAPRFLQYGRMFHPLMLVRQIRPLAGRPRIQLRVRPTGGWEAQKPFISHGSNHIRYELPDQVLRLTTDAPVTMILDERPFILERPLTLLFGPDETPQDSVAHLGRHFFEQTHSYWREWSRYLSIPFEWQEAVIRAAITLKLNSCDDTGAIVAAMTTSIPEAPNSGRNWDYRYCWLRDSYFVTTALNRLGKTRTMEHYLSYIINLAAEGDNLQPVYRINGSADLAEQIVDWPGFRGMGPVRVGNLAYQQVQNDVYGSVILSATHSFFDRRMDRHGDVYLFNVLQQLGEKAVQCFDQPDAGLWELRNSSHVHTFSSVMCWVACSRLAILARHLKQKERAQYWQRHADHMHAVICEKAWNERRQSFVDTFNGEDLDASLLLLYELGFLAADDPRFSATVMAIERELKHGDYIFRYAKRDDFGHPETAFMVCSFWYVDALATLGRREEARELFEHLLAQRNPHGLLSEDINPDTGELWGNFVQTYSMVGLINSAMRLSRPWEQAF